MVPFARIGIECAWGILVLVWFIGAFRSKRAARRSSWMSRFLLFGPVIIVYLLVTTHALGAGSLYRHLWPRTPAVLLAGLALTILGCGFAIWARFSLGSNWSGIPTVKENHELIVRGPYRLVRHPIYSGLLLALAGSALASGRAVFILAWFLVFAAYSIKIRQEEKLMMETFPDAYPAYRRRVKALIPGLL